jgi:hypothetical protein
VAALVGGVIVTAAWLGASAGGAPVLAQGVGDASWTPAQSTTTVAASGFLVPDDSLLFQTEAIWDGSQAEGLGRYLADGLRYTLEVNDRSGRLSATGYWATDHPDPAFDRDDDDGDGRWEEAEVIAGERGPVAGQPYTAIVELSRWHPKRSGGSCEWAWDIRLGEAEILSQLSRELFGEWQAERYTLTYASHPYPRVGPRPDIPGAAARAHCQDPRPRAGQSGVVVTFAAPLAWSDFLALPAGGSGAWTAFEAIGSSGRSDLPWTCGGPVGTVLGLDRCLDLGVSADGVVAAVGYLDDAALDELRAAPTVARVAELQDAVTGLLFDVGGFGVERPGLTVNDAYWELFLPQA